MLASTEPDDRDLTLVGYCEPVSTAPGQRVELKLSSHDTGEGGDTATVDIVRLICGDPKNPALGLVEEVVDAPGFPLTVDVAEQALTPGSLATVDQAPAADGRAIAFTFSARPSTRADQPAELLRFGDVAALWHAGSFGIRAGDTIVASDVDTHHGHWYDIRLDIDPDTNRASLTAVPSPTPSPGTNSALRSSDISVELSTRPVDGPPITIGAGYDGRIAELTMFASGAGTGAENDIDDEVLARWDASIEPAGRIWQDVGPAGCHVTLHQLPTRAVRGPRWDGSSQNPAAAEDAHYDAVHFHRDDLYDAGWETAATLDIPSDLPSGVYCFRSRTASGIDRTPFFVAAPASQRAEIAYLAPVATYLAYANQRIHLTNAEFFAGGAAPPANHRFVRDHPEVGYSMYEYHPDRSGVMFSSHRRPVLNMKPCADGWGFTPDSNIVAFLDHVGLPFDVVTDEQLHADGPDALDGYRVVVTGSHPEYWSTAMLDALADWQAEGGRLMYLGGNGFYWRVAFSDDWPGAMEVRRAEDGTRAWIAEPGEYHHAFGGEYGGLWRRVGRPPNQICGIGFAAQGFGDGAGYVRTHAEPERTDWIFDGVDTDRIGDHGIGGGAAGQEIDRFDTKLGSPEHAVVVATSTEHGPDMLRTKEELHVTVEDASSMSTVRADMVFYEIAGGGAVFSVGSISWFGALATDAYDNDVAAITENVLRRFVDPTPFSVP